MNKKAELRRARRKDCVVPVEGKQGTVFDGVRTVDISRGGVGFVSSKRIPINEKVVIELDFQPKVDPVLVVGQVKWVSKIKDSQLYRIGMSFTDDVEEDSGSRLKQYFTK